MRIQILSTLTACIISIILVNTAAAHIQLAKPLKKRYRLRTVSCFACHDKENKEKTRDDLTKFGDDIAKILEGKNVSDRIAATKEMASDERKKVIGEIEKEYIQALDELDKMKAPGGKLYLESLPAGDIDGTRPR